MPMKKYSNQYQRTLYQCNDLTSSASILLIDVGNPLPRYHLSVKVQQLINFKQIFICLLVYSYSKDTMRESFYCKLKEGERRSELRNVGIGKKVSDLGKKNASKNGVEEKRIGETS
jgi:hypothetical protein